MPWTATPTTFALNVIRLTMEVKLGVTLRLATNLILRSWCAVPVQTWHVPRCAQNMAQISWNTNAATVAQSQSSSVSAQRTSVTRVMMTFSD